MSFPFQKYEGLGNDFILISADDLPEGEVSAEQARQWCDRNFGVGADGVIVVDRHAQALAMRVLNADGSTPEMCGNGLRCVALYALNHGWVSDPDFEVATDAGPHRCVVDQRTGRVIVQMRSASFEPAEISLRSEQPWLDEVLQVGGEDLRVSAVSVGNPHLVTFDSLGAWRLEWAPELERLDQLAEGANVGFAELKSEDRIELHVWERGVGWTLACGTGACAAVAAAVATGRVERHRFIKVVLPGGELDIKVGEDDDPILMDGPARHVYSGSIEAL